MYVCDTHSSQSSYHNNHYPILSEQQSCGNKIIIFPTPATTTTSSLNHQTNKNTSHHAYSIRTQLGRIAFTIGNYFYRKKPNQGHSKPVVQNRPYLTCFWRKRRHFLWCFRPIGSNATDISKKENDLIWTPFEQKNQIFLTHQYDQMRVAPVEDCSRIQDKHIFGGQAVVTVMFKEGIAFALDPEWPEPMTFEITCLPKLNWLQRFRARHHYVQQQQ
ncbi:uncharacterized protein B0P05DRAFT_563285 [Gilbertella persicaria]|uniref:uncharacterized protein n=1 Tax=Gilbertella persicaria TaxID=101096 RepID=UPI00221ECAFA|nr:uncharacterized protein B0P05DRAFT_563285 [Gilbertella persicaria]KAI8050150.1 hypothetical protein B0P05DRAFT_563285 [Gilbertella persicaria]